MNVLFSWVWISLDISGIVDCAELFTFECNSCFYRIYPDSLFNLPTMSSRVGSCIAYINTLHLQLYPFKTLSVTTVNCGLSVLDYWQCQAYCWVNKPKIICINTNIKCWHFFSTYIHYVHEYMPELRIYASYFAINFSLLRHNSKRYSAGAWYFQTVMKKCFWIMGLIRLIFRYLLFCLFSLLSVLYICLLGSITSPVKMFNFYCFMWIFNNNYFI